MATRQQRKKLPKAACLYEGRAGCWLAEQDASCWEACTQRVLSEAVRIMLPKSRTAVAKALEGEGQELVDGPTRGSRADLEQRVSDGALAAMKGGK